MGDRASKRSGGTNLDDGRGRVVRVLLVGRGAPEQGGIAVFIDELLHAPLPPGVELSLLNLTPAQGAPPGGFLSWSNFRRTMNDGWRVVRASGSADVVHIHSALAPAATAVRAGFLASCARLRNCRVVLHAHGGKVISWLEGPRSRRILRLSVMPVHEVIAVSDRVAEVLRPVIGRPVSFIPNGLDLGPYIAVPMADGAAPPRVLYVGHLTRRKGLVDLRDAGRILRRRGVDHEIVVAGGVPDEGASEGELVRDEIGDEVTLLGRVDHDAIPDLLGSVTVFCLPSWWEATPLSIIEAMAAGRPVVATDVGDVPDMVEHGVTGLLVPTNDPTALADALETLLSDPERCTAFGRAGRQRAIERFDIRRMSDAIASRYRVVADDRTAGRGLRS